MTDLDLISIGAKHSTPGQFSREFTEEQWISAARAIESAACAPLLERIAALEATLAASCADERDQLWEATPGGGCSRAIDAESKVAELEAKLARQGAQKMASPAHRATMACVECGGVLGHTRMCSKLPGYCGEADQIPDA